MRYSKIDRRTWNDKKFRQLSPIRASGQALWLYLLTNPYVGSIPGLYQATPEMLAAELRWSNKDFRHAIEEVISLDMIRIDPVAHLMWIPKALNHNIPISLNVVKGWHTAWEELPECDLKTEARIIFDSFLEAMGPVWLDAFHGIAKPKTKTKSNVQSYVMTRAIQEQDIEQDGFAISHDKTLQEQEEPLLKVPLEGEPGERQNSKPISPKRKKSQPEGKAAAEFVLPEWIPAEDWQAFEEMRRKIKHALSDHQRQLIIDKLMLLEAEGCDPVQVLRESTMNEWRGVFPQREGNHGRVLKTAREQAKERERAEVIETIDWLNETGDAVRRDPSDG